MNYKQRASAAGKLMAAPRLKKDKEAGNLSKGAETLVKDWYKEQLYGRRKNIYSKYLVKGTSVEDENIEWMNDELDLGLNITKNEDFYTDSFFTGTPDLLVHDTGLVVDVKSSWDFSTFPLFEEEIPDNNYYYQLQVYMHLTGMKDAMLVYALMDTPEPLVKKEIFYHLRDLEESGEKLTSVERQAIADNIKDYHRYNDLDSKVRLKSYRFGYDASIIEELQAKVIKAREYLETIKI